MEISVWLGPAVMVVIALLGGFGTYITLQANFNATARDHGRRLTEFEEDRKALRTRIEAIERDSVRRDDFERLEDRLGKRLDTLEHSVRNMATQIISALSRRDRGSHE